MEKTSFTQPGFMSLQTKLYQLSTPELHICKEAIRVDFPGFILTNFELLPTQVAFFSGLHPDTFYFMASTVSLAIRNQLPIKLLKDERPAERNASDDPIFKIVREENNMATSEESEGETETDGVVNIIITYE